MLVDTAPRSLARAFIVEPFAGRRATATMDIERCARRSVRMSVREGDEARCAALAGGRQGATFNPLRACEMFYMGTVVQVPRDVLMTAN